MAKRFGRNQKRKLQMRATAAEQTLAYRNEQLDNSRREVRGLRDKIERWDERIQTALGEYSAFLSEPARVVVDRYFTRIPMTYDVSFSPVDMSMNAIETRMNVLDVALFGVASEDDMMRLHKHILFYQQDRAGGQKLLAAYTIDDREVLRRHDPTQLAQFIAEQIVRRLQS